MSDVRPDPKFEPATGAGNTNVKYKFKVWACTRCQRSSSSHSTRFLLPSSTLLGRWTINIEPPTLTNQQSFNTWCAEGRSLETEVWPKWGWTRNGLASGAHINLISLIVEVGVMVYSWIVLFSGYGWEVWQRKWLAWDVRGLCKGKKQIYFQRLISFLYYC